MSGDDLIATFGPGPDDGGNHNTVLLHAVHRVQHGLILPDAVGVVRERMKLVHWEADDLLVMLTLFWW